jgi:A/G-specific adenine glycosylase
MRVKGKEKRKHARDAQERVATALLDWFAANARPLPWRQTRDPYAIWISEIMLQQTQVKTVIPYWERWMRALPDIAALAAAPPDKVLKLWEGLGYYTRARNLQKAAQIIKDKHGGNFPENFEAILALPGIGRYTAGAIASIAFNQPTPILDGNVMRVLCRLYRIRDNPREKAANGKLWELAANLVAAAAGQKKFAGQACSFLNQSLMELGATICTPREPQCHGCPVNNYCGAFATGEMAMLPNLGARPVTTSRNFAAIVVENQKRFLVRQRPAGVVNAHLWEFPNFELHANHADAALVKQELGVDVGSLKTLTSIRHNITRYRMELQVYRAKVRIGSSIPEAWRWVTREELSALAFSSAHRKLAQALTTP